MGTAADLKSDFSPLTNRLVKTLAAMAANSRNENLLLAMR